jgi:diguanylate cyclase (GGDEF)-like protein
MGEHIERKLKAEQPSIEVTDMVSNMTAVTSANTNNLITDHDYKARILIIGKETVDIKLLERTMSEEYIVVMSKSLVEDLVLVSDMKPDLILLDITTMETGSDEYNTRLHEIAMTDGIPVIIIAGDVDERMEDAIVLDPVDSINKPFNMFTVKRRIRNYIELKLLRDRQKNKMIDNLTQIVSRQGFYEVLQQEWGRANRNGSLISVIILDIDYFKRFNDTYGHKLGDDCLYLLAQTIKKLLKRPSDIVARWGSEEFACVLPETDLRGALLIGENIRKSVYDLKIPHGHSVLENSVTVSIGTATMIPNRYHSCEDIIKLAEKGLSSAQEAGGNKVEAML